MEKTKLRAAEIIGVASMLFGMFFGAGNLIFPVHMGQMAGSNVWYAVIGFVITGVGLPLLAVVALGISRSDGLRSLSGRVGRGYSIFFTCALYLTIGPLFAIPRCAATSFSTGTSSLIGTSSWALPVFSLVFFAVVLAFSLFPNGIMTWVGRILTPIFLVCLGILVVAAFLSPMAPVSKIAPEAGYDTGVKALFEGFLEGYNTMDTLAGLAFGIVVVNVIRSLGVEHDGAVAANTVRAGTFSCLFMALIYVLITLVGTQSRGVFDTSAEGGTALSQISQHYFGTFGTVILAFTVTFACLKTAVGLVTSCSETFAALFPRALSYRMWAIIFSVVSFLIANVGLATIIEYAVPVLMFLYPLAITLILLALGGKLFGHDRRVYVSVTALTFVAAIFDLIKALSKTGLGKMIHAETVSAWVEGWLPLFSLGLGWVCPAALGLVIGLILHFVCGQKAKQAA